MIRSRSKQNTCLVGWSYTFRTDGALLNSSTYSYGATPTDRESMLDDNQKQFSDNWLNPKPVLHTVLKRVSFCPGYSYTASADGSSVGRYEILSGHDHAFAPGELACPYPTTAELDAFGVKVLQNLANTMAGQGTLLAIFARDIPKLRGLPKSVLGSGLLKGIAAGFLVYNFVYKPTLNDVEVLRDTLKVIDGRIELLRQACGEPIAIRTMTKIENPSDRMRTTSFSAFSEAFQFGYRSSECTIYLNSTVWVRFNTRDVDWAAVQLEMLKRYFGVNLERLTLNIWEAIPYSFVVDWIVKVQQYLDKLATMFEDPIIPYTVHSSTYSVKVVHMYEHFVLPYSAYGNSEISLGSIEQKLYERKLGLPVTSASVVGFGDPGLHQLALGIALSVQKML